MRAESHHVFATITIKPFTYLIFAAEAFPDNDFFRETSEDMLISNCPF